MSRPVTKLMKASAIIDSMLAPTLQPSEQNIIFEEGTASMTDNAANVIQPIYVSLELSKKKWLAAALLPGEEKVKLRNLPGGDAEALMKYLDKLTAQTERRVGQAVEIKFCYEVGYDGFWLARILRRNGIDIRVLDPASFLVSRRGRRVKTDRIDAEAMVFILKAYLGGDKSVCTEVRIPTHAEEDAKRMMRERGNLVAERTRHIGRIRALLALHGIRTVKAIWGGDWRKQLDDMRTGDGEPLPPHLRREIERQFERLAIVNKQLKEIEKDRAETIKDETTAFPCPEKVKALEDLKGIGKASATMLVAEVFHRQFDNRRRLASFLGLAPSHHSSGDVERDRGISKAGNKPARVLLVELAWCWLRYQPESDLTKWYRDRFVGRGKRAVKVGIVALARKLLIALWRYVETGLVPHGAELRAAS